MKISPLKLIASSALVMGLLLILAAPGSAQSRAIKGKVTDDKDQPVIDAKVTVEATDVYRIFSSKTNKKGEFYFLLGLQYGEYRVTVRKAGFQPAFKDRIIPEMREEFEANFKLNPGQDYKLPWEMTKEERDNYVKQNAERTKDQDKKKQFSAEVRARFEKGVELYNLKQYEEALVEFTAALEKDPKQPGILSRQGDCYIQLKKNEEALACYDKAIELSPNNAELYANKGVILSKLGKQTESQDMFKKAAELDPQGSAKYFFNLGITLFNAGDTGKAADAFKQAIAADPNNAESYYHLGMCLSGNPDTTPAALEALNKYVTIGQKPDQIQIAKELIKALGGK
jgi:tetratricopeptide (TPR) repeat protein